VSGFSLHHERIGQNRDRALVLLHGFMGSSADWRPVAESLGDIATCLCVDLPGHGKSTGGTPDEYDFVATAARIVEEVVDASGFNTFCIGGYSMGGRVALYTALHFPMRVDGLIIESAMPGLTDATERADRARHDDALAERLEIEPLDTFVPEWYDQPLFASMAAHADLLAATVSQRLKNEGHELAKALRGFSTGRMPPLWDEWRKNYIPSLLITGESDEKYGAIAREMLAACPKARHVAVPGAGHNVHAEVPTEYIMHLRRFLAEDTL